MALQAIGLIDPVLQFIDGNGAPYAAGTVSFYTSGTQSFLNIYSDRALTVPLPNPLPLNAAGRSSTSITGTVSPVYFQSALYDYVLKDANGVTVYGPITFIGNQLGIIPIANGGTGLSTTPTDGQLLIGKTSTSAYVLSTLTGSSTVTVTNGSGTITLTAPKLNVTVLSSSLTAQAVGNTTSPTSVFSFVVPGGTLSTNKALRLTLTGKYRNESGGSSTCAYTGSYGGTNFVAGSFRNTSTGTIGMQQMVALLNANGATNSQRVNAIMWPMQDATIQAVAAWSASTTVQPQIAFNDTMAVDSTVDQTFDITWTHGTANAAIIYTRFAAVLELLG